MLYADVMRALSEGPAPTLRELRFPLVYPTLCECLLTHSPTGYPGMSLHHTNLARDGADLALLLSLRLLLCLGSPTSITCIWSITCR